MKKTIRTEATKPTTPEEALARVERDAEALNEHYSRVAPIRDQLSDALVSLRTLLGSVKRAKAPRTPRKPAEVDLAAVFGGDA